MKKLYILVLILSTIVVNSQTIGLQTYASGFSSPVGIERPVGDTRFFIVQKGGIIRVVTGQNTVLPTPFLNLTGIVSTGDENGLLGLAFHPNYATNGLFYLNYTQGGNTVIARYSVSSTDPNVANPTRTVLMTISQPFGNHNGGCIKFGPDGYLYIGMGDGGSGGDPFNYSQNLTVDTTNPTRVYLGKMLRIDVDTIAGSLNYGFPPTNPYVNEAGKEEIWAYGLRNPWRFSFNRLNGDLWIGDVGQGNIEEIDKIQSPLPNTGLNFGWNCYEGNVVYSPSGDCPPLANTVAPIAQYTHPTGCSISGGYVYTGSSYPNLQGKYLFSDYCNNKVGYINNSGTITWSSTFTGNFSAFGEDINGELYIAGVNSGIISKIIDTSLTTNDFSKNGFSIYPNPAKDLITVSSSTQNTISSIEIFEITGKKLHSEQFQNNSEVSLSVSNFSSGIYLLVTQDSTGNKFQTKFVVE
jgi:glucose/arabinose dehydrogenase